MSLGRTRRTSGFERRGRGHIRSGENRKELPKKGKNVGGYPRRTAGKTRLTDNPISPQRKVSDEGAGGGEDGKVLHNCIPSVGFLEGAKDGSTSNTTGKCQGENGKRKGRGC